MIKKTKVKAAILIIGNEILSGRTQDTNTTTLATWLNSIGVKVNEVRVIPDIERTIIDTLNRKLIASYPVSSKDDSISKWHEFVKIPYLNYYLKMNLNLV